MGYVLVNVPLSSVSGVWDARLEGMAGQWRRLVELAEPSIPRFGHAVSDDSRRANLPLSIAGLDWIEWSQVHSAVTSSFLVIWCVLLSQAGQHSRKVEDA